MQAAACTLHTPVARGEQGELHSTRETALEEVVVEEHSIHVRSPGGGIVLEVVPEAGSSRRWEAEAVAEEYST